MHHYRTSARLVRLTLIVIALSTASPLAEGAAPPLGSYNADIKETSISGISSGAFMAVQFGVSWSSIVKGVGVIAGGPYYCAQGTAIDGLLGNLGPALSATGPCMKGPPPDLEPLFEKPMNGGAAGRSTIGATSQTSASTSLPVITIRSSIQKSETLPTAFICIT